MRKRATSAWLTVLACWLASATACRSSDVCEGTRCDEPSPVESAGAGGSPDVTPPEPSDAGMGGLAGEAGQGGAAGAAPEPIEPLVCEEGFADCDGSTFTGCESNLSVHHRNCGACGQRCDGLCQGRDCKQEERIAEGSPTAFVATSTVAFAVMGGQNGRSVMQFDLQTGDSSVLIGEADFEYVLAVSADRVYILDPASGSLQSALLSGGDLKTERSRSVEGIGASDDGVYFLDSVESPGTGNTNSRLWFRATGAPSWKKIHEGETWPKIVASSEYGLLLQEYDSGGNVVLQEIHGETVTSLAERMAGIEWNDVAMTAAGPVLLSDTELIWLGPPLARYAVPPYTLNFRPPVVLDSALVLGSNVGGVTYVQHYGRSGPTAVKGGLANFTEPLFIDGTYLWYVQWDSPIDRHIARAEWFRLAP